MREEDRCEVSPWWHNGGVMLEGGRRIILARGGGEEEMEEACGKRSMAGCNMRPKG